MANVKINGQVKGKEINVTVRALKGATQVDSKSTDQSGKYSLSVPEKDEYIIIVEEADADNWSVINNNRYVEVDTGGVDKVNFKTVSFKDITQEQNNDELDKRFVKDLLMACLLNADDWMKTKGVQEGRKHIRKIVNDALRRKGEPA